MKNGIMVYQPSQDKIFNIGDYIQSLAAAQFFNKIDCFVNREKLNDFNEGEIKLILNGWFMHQPNNWPPSPNIKPLFVSFHLNKLAKDEMLKEKGVLYFKKHEPIGCRDYDTVKLLRSKGVEAYFTGCMTLTLGETFKNKCDEKEGIYFVDPFFESPKKILDVCNGIILLFMKFKIISAIFNKSKVEKTLMNLLRYSFFYSTYSDFFSDEVFLEAEFVKHEIPDVFPSEESKFEYAKELLRKYAKAKFIVTSRIHVALPCLGLETPVIYVDDINQSEESYCRLNGIRDLFNVLKSDKGRLTSDVLKEKIGKNAILKNKEDYKEIKNEIIEKCKRFAQI